MRIIWLGLIALLLTGCTQQILTGRVAGLVLSDSQSAQTVLVASAPLLPPSDPWLACMKTIEVMLTQMQAGPGAKTAVNGILTEASRLHVLDAMLSAVATNPGQSSCAQIILSIQLRAAAGATPGGALLPLR
jgi:hypothetical protein